MPRYSESDARAAVAASSSFSEALRRLGLRPAGGNHRVLREQVRRWGISTEHFDPWASQRRGGPNSRSSRPLEEVMVEHSTYSRQQLKDRLYREGLKARACELCGQGEEWRGRRMGLVLDHINGVPDDHRLQNLRIVCPNCAATLDTHCGRKNRTARRCRGCDAEFWPRTSGQTYCSRACGLRAPPRPGPRPELRKVARPPHAQLQAEIHAMGYEPSGDGTASPATRCASGCASTSARQRRRLRERRRSRSDVGPQTAGGVAATSCRGRPTVSMRLARTARRLLVLPALVLATAVAPASAQITALSALPADLSPALAVATVDWLPAAPLLPPLTQPAAAPLLGLPGSDHLTVRGAGGGVLLGQEGGDRLVGGSGPDHLDGGTGADTAIGQGGADELDGGSGDDQLQGGDGADRLFGGSGHDRLEAGGGNDVVDGGAAPDVVDAGDGDDLVHGGSGADTVRAAAGNDVVYADSGPDHIDAGDGDDVVYVNNGTAVADVDCGAGTDTVVINPYDQPGGISNAQAVRRGAISNCEDIVQADPVTDPTVGRRELASDAGAIVHGTDRNDNLLGGRGSDTLIGSAGDDVLWGDRNHGDGGHGAHDELDAGPGADTVYGGRGTNHVDGGPGADQLQGGEGANMIGGGDGDDVIRLRGGGSNVVKGGNGNDSVMAFTRRPASVDCGPGGDTVVYGRVRPHTTDCERVISAYSRAARAAA